MPTDRNQQQRDPIDVAQVYLVSGKYLKELLKQVRKQKVKPGAIAADGTSSYKIREAEDGTTLDFTGGGVGSIDVADDIPEEVDNVTKITFTGAINFGTVTDGGNGEALVKILPDDPGSGTFVLGNVNGALVWLDTTNCS